MKEEDFDDYTDEELTKKWNYLETRPLSSYVESVMDTIDLVLKKRGVEAWNAKGEITQRRPE